MFAEEKSGQKTKRTEGRENDVWECYWGCFPWYDRLRAGGGAGERGYRREEAGERIEGRRASMASKAALGRRAAAGLVGAPGEGEGPRGGGPSEGGDPQGTRRGLRTEGGRGEGYGMGYGRGYGMGYGRGTGRGLYLYAVERPACVCVYGARHGGG